MKNLDDHKLLYFFYFSWLMALLAMPDPQVVSPENRPKALLILLGIGAVPLILMGAFELIFRFFEAMAAIEEERNVAAIRAALEAHAPQFNGRLPPELTAALDAWIAAQPEPKPTRPEAIRTALEDWLRERTP